MLLLLLLWFSWHLKESFPNLAENVLGARRHLVAGIAIVQLVLGKEGCVVLLLHICINIELICILSGYILPG